MQRRHLSRLWVEPILTIGFGRMIQHQTIPDEDTGERREPKSALIKSGGVIDELDLSSIFEAPSV